MGPLLTPLRLRVVNLGHAPRPHYNALSFASSVPSGFPIFPFPSPADASASSGKGSSGRKASKAGNAGAQASDSAREGVPFGGTSGAALAAVAEGSRHQVAQVEALYMHLLEELRCACGEILEAQQEAKAHALETTASKG